LLIVRTSRQIRDGDENDRICPQSWSALNHRDGPWTVDFVLEGITDFAFSVWTVGYVWLVCFRTVSYVWLICFRTGSYVWLVCFRTVSYVWLVCFRTGSYVWLVCFRTVSYVWLVCFVLRARFSEYTTGGVLTKCVALYEQFQNTIEKIVRKRYPSLHTNTWPLIVLAWCRPTNKQWRG
jgi:hypothetical protein